MSMTRYYIIDGNHRVAAAKALGYEYIDTFVPGNDMIASIPVEALFYNRPIDDERARQLAENWDPRLMGPIWVTTNADDDGRKDPDHHG